MSARNSTPAFAVGGTEPVTAALVKALEAAERHHWAVRNLGNDADPTRPDRLALKMEVERTENEANMLRKEALALVQGMGVRPSDGWRSVDDELPPTDETVIVMGRVRSYRGAHIGFRAGAGYWISGHQDDLSNEDWRPVTGVTHWMPLPVDPGKEPS